MPEPLPLTVVEAALRGTLMALMLMLMLTLMLMLMLMLLAGVLCFGRPQTP